MDSLQKYLRLLLLALLVIFAACSKKEQSGVEAGNTKVAGVVFDPSGKPVPAAVVRLYVQTPDSLILIAEDTTDQAGNYTLQSGQEGMFILQVSIGDMLWTEQELTVEEGDNSHDLQLPATPMDEFADTAGVITDSRDGQQYPWVRIGSQVWLAKNLNYSGDNGTGGKSYQLGWCYGSDVSDTSSHVDNSNCEEYGRLYSWKAAMVLPDSCDTLFCSSQISSPHQGICPDGWRLPDTLDFAALDSFVRIEQGDTLGAGYSEVFLKISNADSNWNRSPFISSDPYGFAMKPGGSRILLSGIGLRDGELGSYGYVWTSTIYPQTGGAYTWEFNSTVMVRSSAGKMGSAVSVRCMR